MICLLHPNCLATNQWFIPKCSILEDIVSIGRTQARHYLEDHNLSVNFCHNVTRNVVGDVMNEAKPEFITTSTREIMTEVHS